MKTHRKVIYLYGVTRTGKKKTICKHNENHRPIIYILVILVRIGTERSLYL